MAAPQLLQCIEALPFAVASGQGSGGDSCPTDRQVGILAPVATAQGLNHLQKQYCLKSDLNKRIVVVLSTVLNVHTVQYSIAFSMMNFKENTVDIKVTITRIGYLISLSAHTVYINNVIMYNICTVTVYENTAQKYYK